MPRLMTQGPARDFIYYAGMIGVAAAMTHIFYLYVNGLI